MQHHDSAIRVRNRFCEGTQKGTAQVAIVATRLQNRRNRSSLKDGLQHWTPTGMILRLSRAIKKRANHLCQRLKVDQE